MPGLADLFAKGSVAEQFLMWNVLSQLTQGLINPVAQSIANSTWQADPNVPLPAEAAADMVARGKLVPDQGEQIAAKSGIGADNFAHLVAAAKHAPPFEVLVEGVRRKLIGAFGGPDGGTEFAAGLAALGIDERWWNLMAEVVVNKPTGEAALNALLQGQISRDRAYALWLQAGEDPDWFQDAFNSQGTAPTPDMLGDLANRRIIPWTGTGPGVVSFEQGFLEGPWRNKWLAPMRAQAQYRIPPRSITAMLHNGALTDAQALAKYQEYGMTAEDAAAMLADAHHAKAATAKELTISQIGQLYKDAKIDRAKALALITALGYSPANAELILSLQDVVKADAHVTAAINRVRTLYVAHKITAPSAKAALTDLHVAEPQAVELMDLWTLEIGLNVRQLTEAQIVAAWTNGIMTQPEASTELIHLGYTEFDAWVLLSNANKAPLPGKPAMAAGVGVNP